MMGRSSSSEKGKGDGSSEDEIDGWSDIESQDKKRGTPKPRQSIFQRLVHGKLFDGKKQLIFESKFKEKEVKEILHLLRKEQDLEGIEDGDGRKCVPSSHEQAWWINLLTPAAGSTTGSMSAECCAVLRTLKK